MMHQNYIKCVMQYYNKHEKSYDLLADIAISMAKGDLIENYIYSDQNWDMQEVHGFFSCVNPSFKLTHAKLCITADELRPLMEFPADLNKTSIKRINKKNIVNSNNCLKNFEINDFICIDKLIKKLIDDDKIEECVQLFDGYNAKVENIESILKIDKINETKSVLQTHVRKKFSQLLGSNKTQKTYARSKTKTKKSK